MTTDNDPFYHWSLYTVGVGYYGTEDYGTVVPWLAENHVIAHFKAVSVGFEHWK